MFLDIHQVKGVSINRGSNFTDDTHSHWIDLIITEEDGKVNYITLYTGEKELTIINQTRK